MDISQFGGATSGMLPAQMPQFNQQLQDPYGGVPAMGVSPSGAPASGMPKTDATKDNTTKINTKINTKNNTKINTKNNTKDNTKDNKKDNTKDNNKNKNNNNQNNASNNNRNNNNVLNTIKNIEINTTKLPIWILLLLTNILLIWSYIVTPIRYSSEEFEGVISFNKLYYYLHIILLFTLGLYGYSLCLRQPLVKNNTSFNTLGVVIVLVIGFFAINISYKSPVKEDGAYKTAPGSLYKSRRMMVAIHTILLLSLAGTMGTDIYYKNINPLGLLPYNKLKNMYGVCSIITLAGIVYLLVNSTKYNVRKYKLPQTWIR